MTWIALFPRANSKSGSALLKNKQDAGESFRVSRDVSLDTAILALMVAKQWFGDVLRLDGDTAFRDRMIHAAAVGGVAIRFSDPTAEMKRRNFIHITTPMRKG